MKIKHFLISVLFFITLNQMALAAINGEIVPYAERDIFQEQHSRLGEKYTSTLQSLEQKCNKGNSKACVNRGKFALYVDKDYQHQTALEFFQKACKKNNADGCGYLAYTKERIGQETTGKKRYYSREVLDLYDNACENGSSFACTIAVYAIHSDILSQKAKKRANDVRISKDMFDIFYKACLLQVNRTIGYQHTITENQKYQYHWIDEVKHEYCQAAQWYKEDIDRKSIPLDIDL